MRGTRIKETYNLICDWRDSVIIYKELNRESGPGEIKTSLGRIFTKQR